MDMETGLSEEAVANEMVTKPFSSEVTKTLESLYARGMTVWGKVHSDAVDVATSSTSLSLLQVKVV